jgi:hypothetical protein
MNANPELAAPLRECPVRDTELGSYPRKRLLADEPSQTVRMNREATLSSSRAHKLAESRPGSRWSKETATLLAFPVFDRTFVIARMLTACFDSEI